MQWGYRGQATILPYISLFGGLSGAIQVLYRYVRNVFFLVTSQILCNILKPLGNKEANSAQPQTPKGSPPVLFVEVYMAEIRFLPRLNPMYIIFGYL